MKNKRKTTTAERAKLVRLFIADSMDDYLAARTTILAGLPKQAAVLGSTSIEKAFKALLAFNGNHSRGHLKKAHWNAARNFDKELLDYINEDFLKLNQKAYKLRYTDDLPINYNLVIASREYLAELDHTIISLVRRFDVNEDNPNTGTEFTRLLNSKDSRLLQGNYILTEGNKDDFIYAEPQLIYEIRNTPSHKTVSVSYSSIRAAKNSSFLREGCVFLPEPNNKHTFELSHYPIPPPNLTISTKTGQAIRNNF